MMVHTIHTVAMDTTVLEVDTVELLPPQGRVVVIPVDMGTLGVVDSYQGYGSITNWRVLVTI